LRMKARIHHNHAPLKRLFVLPSLWEGLKGEGLARP